MRIPTEIVPSVTPEGKSPGRVQREFMDLLAAGATLHVAGEARKQPSRLLEGGYLPRFKLKLFDTTFYLTSLRQNPDLRFFVAYIRQRDLPPARSRLYAHIFYKDVSLVWRSASHLAGPIDNYWVGKGDFFTTVENGCEFSCSREETTDLPVELQVALDGLSRRVRRPHFDERAVRLVLRRAAGNRVEAYDDFIAPRRRAAAEPRNRINGGRPVARFRRRLEPGSLVFTKGFEPDFSDGILETTVSRSVLYGGDVRRFRILSSNRQIQYLFFAARQQIWIIPPQALTTELSRFGVRTIDVTAPDNLCVPGYEYHFMDQSEDPPVFVSQIPAGFAGSPSAQDPSRADASSWLESLPIVQEFRRKVVGRRGSLRLQK